MEEKHTPAPWEIWDNDDNHSGPGCWYVIKHGDECVCEIYAIDEENPDVEKHEANARLIAAAPELLGACENVAKDFGKERMDGCEGITDKRQCDKSACIDSDYCERREKLYSMLCNVIAKAKGK